MSAISAASASPSSSRALAYGGVARTTSSQSTATGSSRLARAADDAVAQGVSRARCGERRCAASAAPRAAAARRCAGSTKRSLRSRRGRMKSLARRRPAEAVAQHPDEGGGAGAVGRRVQGADHQGLPDPLDQFRRLPRMRDTSRLTVRDARRRAASPAGAAAPAPAPSPSATPARQPLGANQRQQRRQRRQQRTGHADAGPCPVASSAKLRPLHQQAAAAGKAHRPAFHVGIVERAEQLEQRQHLGVGAEQQVLAVVELDRVGALQRMLPVQRDPAGAAAGLRRCVDRAAPGARRAPGGSPRPARPSRRRSTATSALSRDVIGCRRHRRLVIRGGRPLTQVRQASQNLRSGVSAMRCVMHPVLVALDLVEQRRVDGRHDEARALGTAVDLRQQFEGPAVVVPAPAPPARASSRETLRSPGRSRARPAAGGRPGRDAADPRAGCRRVPRAHPRRRRG